MKPASARRISSHADGPDVARARGRPATSAPNGPISSARSVPRRGKAPGWSCPGATPTPWRRTSSRSVPPSIPAPMRCLIVDQAGWHLTPKLAIPDNITVLALPPRSPELNPVENVWQFMRDNWLSRPDLQILLIRHGRAVLPSLEQPHRPTMEDHVPRHAQMGAWVMINDRWYNMALLALRMLKDGGPVSATGGDNAFGLPLSPPSTAFTQ